MVLPTGVFFGVVLGLLSGPLGGLVVGLLAWLLFGMFFGLGAAIQHYSLRFWLWRIHAFPWETQPFLDAAVTCIFLRRIGGGYSFVHRLLLDHFANLPTRPAPTSASYSPASEKSPPANNPSA